MKTMFGSSLPSGDPGLISYLRYLCLLEFSGVQHVLCCYFLFFLCLVYPMLAVSLSFFLMSLRYSITFILKYT